MKTDIEPEMEEQFNLWYEEEHIPRLLNVPGVIMARRGINAGKGQTYFEIYEDANLDVQHTSAYKNAIETKWTKKYDLIVEPLREMSTKQYERTLRNKSLKTFRLLDSLHNHPK